MTIFLPILWLFFAAGSFSMISRRQFGYVLPVVQLAVPPVLYVSQFLFGSFTPGVILLLVPAAGFLPLYLFLRKIGSAKDVKRLVFSEGFYALLALVCIYLVIDLKRSLVKWDELMHWGMMVKEMFRLDRFYAVPESNLLMHKDYPPFAPLLELFWCRLCGGFNEMAVSMGAHIFTMSLVLGPVSEMAGDEAGTSSGEAGTSGSASKARVTVGLFVRQLLLALCIMLIILSFDGFHIFMTIYTDIMIAAVFGYTTCLVFTGRVFRSGWSLVACTLGINALLQIKEVGIGFFLLAVFYILLRIIAAPTGEFPGQSRPRALIWLVPMAGLPAFGFAVWKKYISALSVSGQFDFSSLTMSDLTGIVRGAVEGSDAGLRKETLVRFIVAVFQNNIFTGWFQITFVSAAFLVLLALILMCRRYRQSFPPREAAALALTMTAGTAGYGFMVLISYLFAMEAREMEEFINFPRYMGCYVTAEVLSLLMICVYLQAGAETAAGNKKAVNAGAGTGTGRSSSTMRYALAALLLAVMLCPANLLYFIPQKLHGNPRYPFRQYAETLTAVVPPASRVFLIADSKVNDYQLFIAYYANELRISMEYIDAFSYRYSEEPKLKEQVLNSMAENDYVYVIHSSASLEEAFADVTSDGSLKGDTLYKVETAGGTVRLQVVGFD